MKKTTQRIAILAVLAFTFVGCSNSDMARVTIKFGIPPQAKAYTPSLFDRIVSLISFSTKANANPPESLYRDINRIDILVLSGTREITSSTITQGSSDWNEGIASLELPAGGPYTFYVNGQEEYEGFSYTYYKGFTLVESLIAGSNTSITINMGLIPSANMEDYSFTAYFSDGTELRFNYMNDTIPDLIRGVRIYKATARYNEFQDTWETGSYSLFMETVPEAGVITYIPEDNMAYWDSCDIPPDGYEISVYKVIPFNEFGEGDAIEQLSFQGGCLN